MRMFTIPGRMESLNNFIDANRRNVHVGNSMKRNGQHIAELCIVKASKHLQGVREPVVLHYKFYEPNCKRDLDNVSSFAHKVIQDALVSTKVLHNDGWKNIAGYSDAFYVDKDNPRIEVYIEEVEPIG